MAVNRIDLLNHTFSRSLRGYATEEVDGFLQDVADALGRLSDERVRLLNRVSQLESLIEEYARREESLQEALVATRKMSDDMKAQAQREAQLIIDSAQGRAESLTNHANLRLARILEEISEARRLKAQFEFKVRSVIEGHLKLLELGQLEDTRMEKAVTSLGRRPAGSSAEDGDGPGGDNG